MRLLPRLSLFLFALLPLHALADTASLDADATLPPFTNENRHAQVLDCMAANQPSGNLSARFVITTRDAAEDLHRIAGVAYLASADASHRMVLRLTAPRHIAGISYLIEDIQDSSEILVYLPSLGKTRKVVLGESDLTILATALTLSDLRQVFDLFSQSWIDYPGKLDQRSVQRVNFVPVPGPVPGGSRDYLQLRTWVDDKTCLPLQTQLQRKSGNKVIARLQPDSIRKLGNSWIVTRATVKDESTGVSSEIELRDIEHVGQLPAGRFESDSFYQ